MAVMGAAANPRPVATASPKPRLPQAFVPPPILMYHRVDVDRPADAVGRALTVTPAEFAAQLAYLHSRGIAGITLDALRARLEAGQPLGRVVVLTFDDGYADQYRYAVPLLDRYGDRATFFVVMSTLGTPRHLSWRELRRMNAQGEEIAAHGMQHDDLSLMTAAQQAYQIDDSIARLHEYLGSRVDSYCYPSGRFNRTTLDLLRAAGVELAVTTDPAYVLAPENRLELTRVRVERGWSIAQFASALLRTRQDASIVRR